MRSYTNPPHFPIFKDEFSVDYGLRHGMQPVHSITSHDRYTILDADTGTDGPQARDAQD